MEKPMMLEEKLEFTISLDRLQRKEVVEALNELMTALREADTEEDQKSEGCRSASSEPTNGALHRAPGEGHPPRSKGRQKRVKGPNTPEDFWGFSVEKIEETLGLTTDRVPHEHNSRDYGALQARWLDYLKFLGKAPVETARQITLLAYRDLDMIPPSAKALGGLLGSLARWSKKRGVPSPISQDKDRVYHYEG
jgi:hypothetical protein